MGKTKKSRHRYPVEQMMRIKADITPEYQAQVDRSTERRSREYAQALKRLEKAEARALAAGPKPNITRKRSNDASTKKLIGLWAEVEYRRQELMQIERLMGGAYVGQRNAGRGSFKPVGFAPNRSNL